MYKSILVPLDRSDAAEQAVQPAIEEAKAFNGSITLIYVFEIIPLLPKDKEAEYQRLTNQGQEYLETIKKGIEDAGVSVQVAIKEGDPGMAICKYAGENAIDLVVMSASGRGDIERWAIGSVSDKVLRHSPKSVLLVRSPLRDVLRGKAVLVVDDEPDMLDTVEEELDMCVVHKASSHDAALDCLKNYRYDIVVLDIMGVDGFDLLKRTVSKGIPTVMLTAHALSPDALRKSAMLGAVSFVPKDKLFELEATLVDVIHNSGRPIWKKVFDRLAPYFRSKFRWDSKQEQAALQELQALEKR